MSTSRTINNLSINRLGRTTQYLKKKPHHSVRNACYEVVPQAIQLAPTIIKCVDTFKDDCFYQQYATDGDSEGKPVPQQIITFRGTWTIPRCSSGHGWCIIGFSDLFANFNRNPNRLQPQQAIIMGWVVYDHILAHLYARYRAAKLSRPCLTALSINGVVVRNEIEENAFR